MDPLSTRTNAYRPNRDHTRERIASTGDADSTTSNFALRPLTDQWPDSSLLNWESSPPQQNGMRQSGIEIIGPVPWGTHFCQFYTTPEDLVETLVPYFKAGLAENEFCMWITSAPLHVEEALAALAAVMPDLDDYLAKGQIEILDYTQWYTLDGKFDTERTLQGWITKLEDARRRGFEGLRLTGNTFWLEETTWKDFTHYESRVNEVIGGQRMLALCTYSLEKCGVHEILDVVVNHQFALIKNAGRWEILESMQHKAMEQALRESEARFHSLFEGMTEGFALHEIVCDEQGRPCDYRFLDVNPAFERLTGLKRADVVGRLVSQALPGDDPRWVEMYGRVALTGEPVHFENYSPALKMHYEVFAYRPAPRQFAVIFLNVTERKRLEEETRRLSQAVEQSPATIVITDLTGAIEYANPRFSELTGFTLEEARGNNPRILKSGRTSQEQYADLWKTIRSGNVWRGEFCNRKKNGDYYWESAQISPVVNENGEITHFMAIKEDITERKLFEEALHETQDRLLLTGEVAEMGTWDWDLTKEILAWDGRSKAIFGLPPKAEVTFEGFLAALHPDDRCRVEAGIQKALDERGIVDLEYRILTPDAQVRWIHARGRCVTDKGGQPVRQLGVMMDVTQLRAAEHEVQSQIARIEVQRRLLEQREQERLQIARDLHDGPVQALAGVNFSLQGLLMDSCAPEVAKQLEAIKSTVQDQIAELRAYAGELRPPTLAKFGLGKAIRSNLENLQEKHPGIHFKYLDIQDGELLPDEKRLALFRIYQESMVNIIKHARATEVAIRLVRSRNEVLLEIQDNGVGFRVPSDWLDLARQGHLGLVGLRERAEFIGGCVDLISTPGQGTRLQVVVPLAG